MFRRPYWGGRGYYGWPRRRRYYGSGCGCGGLGLSVLLSAIATILLNLFLGRRY